MIEYLQLVEDVLTKGKKRQGPKSMGTLALIGKEVRYDLSEGFPLITTRDLSKSWQKNIVPELLWILSGSTNANDLHKYGSRLWDRWAQAAHEKIGYENGELGPVYGHQLRNFANQVDQLTQVVGMLKRDPQNRRSMISFWNLGDVEKPDGTHIVDVAPCIASLHFLELDGKLNVIMNQRSADIPVGVPHDVAEWSLFLMMVAKEIGLVPGEFVHYLHDAHIYEDQIPAMKEMLKREPRPRPNVSIIDSPSGTIYDHEVLDFQLSGYDPHPPIKDIPVAT